VVADVAGRDDENDVFVDSGGVIADASSASRSIVWATSAISGMSISRFARP
jgi:hypothetical protein